MEFITLKQEDQIAVLDNEIHVFKDVNEISLPIDTINDISIFTTDEGPFIDDVFLAIKFETKVIVVPSEHPLYSAFLFDELGKKIKIDYEQIIKSSMSTDNAVFVLYKKA